MQSWDTIKGYWNTICRILLHWHLRDCKGRVPRKHIVAVARAENLSDLGQWFFGSSLFYTGSAKTLQSHPFLVLPKSSVPSADYTFSFYLSGHVRSSWCQNVTSHLSFSFNPIWLFWSALPLSHGNCSKAGGSDGRNPFESSRLRLRSWQQGINT